MDTHARRSSHVGDWVGLGPVWPTGMGRSREGAGVKGDHTSPAQHLLPVMGALPQLCSPAISVLSPIRCGDDIMNLAEATEKGPTELGGRRVNTEHPILGTLLLLLCTPLALKPTDARCRKTAVYFKKNNKTCREEWASPSVHHREPQTPASPRRKRLVQFHIIFCPSLLPSQILFFLTHKHTHIHRGEREEPDSHIWPFLLVSQEQTGEQ